MRSLIGFLISLPFVVAGFVLGVLWRAVTKRWAEDLNFEGKAYVLDGDTLAFDGDIRVRLYGMDAPEMDHPEGLVSKRYLESLIAEKPVKVVFVEEDKYGRGVCKVYSAEGHDLSARMVGDGYARSYGSFTSAYVQLEKKARKTQAGLWGQNGLALHPEFWRKAQR